MKTLLAATAAVLLISACGADDGSTTATDPAGAGAATPAAPAAVPAAPGTVNTRDLVTVMDTGTPEACLGPVAESYPPQCTGPALAGWDWADHRQMFEHHGPARWGTFALTGSFDGSTLTVDSAVPAALYDVAAPVPTVYPTPAVARTDAELLEIQDAVTAALPGVQTASTDGERVLVDVVYDDGSLQAWADEEYGEGVVVVSSLLVDQA